MSFNQRGVRVCDHCGCEMRDGFMIDGGREHYCSEKCLYKHYTPEEFKEMYDDGNGDSCYTEWYDEDPEEQKGEKRDEQEA